MCVFCVIQSKYDKKAFSSFLTPAKPLEGYSDTLY